MTFEGGWKHKNYVTGSKNSTKRRCTSTLELGSDVTNITQEPTTTKSLEVSSNPIKSIKRKRNEQNDTWKCKKVSASVNVNCPLLDNHVTNNACNDHADKELIIFRTPGEFPVKRKHSFKENCVSDVLLPEAKVPPKVCSWGLDLFYRPRNEPKNTSAVSVWGSDIYFRPKEKGKIKCEEVINEKMLAEEIGCKTRTKQKNQGASPAKKDIGCSLMQHTESNVYKAETIQVPAKQGHFDDLDELPSFFKGESCE